MSCLLRHRWGTWTQYTERGMMGNFLRGKTVDRWPYVEVREWRRCARCGHTQDRLIKEGEAPYATGAKP